MIRTATKLDTAGIGVLLQQLGYPTEHAFLKEKILKLLNDSSHVLIVYEDGEIVKGVMSIHFLPQMALEGDVAIISYFAVLAGERGSGIGRMMEEYCVRIATERGCEKIQLHCNIDRTEAHKFYERQGYSESRKYFSKKLLLS